MASATEAALLALNAVLVGLSPTLPNVMRNEDLSSRLVDIAQDLQSYCNLWDGKQQSREEYLGADNSDNAYGLVHEARLEFAVTGGTPAQRDELYDQVLCAVDDAIKADRTLGGFVDHAELGELEGQGSGLITDGIAGAKGVIVPIVLEFRSSRPF